MIKEVTPFSILPVSLSEAKAQLRISNSVTDSYIEGLISAATRIVENEVQFPLTTTVYTLYAYDFSNCMSLSKWPVQSIDSVKYYDLNGTDTTIASGNYRLVEAARPCYLEFDDDYILPDVDDRWDAVRVTYTAGFDSASAIPASLRHAVLMLVASMNENRQDEVVGRSVGKIDTNSMKLIAPYRLWL